MAKGRLSKGEFDRMVARHRIEIERASEALRREFAEFEQRFAQLREEMERAQSEIDAALGKGEPFAALGSYRERFGSFPKAKGRKRRPPRGFEGGEPVPVYPKPKPTPLTDGAEAPIE